MIRIFLFRLKHIHQNFSILIYPSKIIISFTGFKTRQIDREINKKRFFAAFETLGFGAAYQEAALSVLDECKEAAQKRLMRQNSRLDKCGIPEDELLKQQQELFEKV